MGSSTLCAEVVLACSVPHGESSMKPLHTGEGRTNIMATLGRTLGPFGDACAAYKAADLAGLKLGLTVQELEVYMTRERKILKGQRKG